VESPQVARSESMPWQPLNEPDAAGILVKVLRFDQATRRAPTTLLKFEPGASYPAHNHPGGEEIFVLEGEIRFGGELFRKGDYLYTPPNHRHAVRSETGCVILAIVPEEVEKVTT